MRSRQARRAKAATALSAPWRLWIADNLRQGATVSDLRRELVASGVPKRIARHEIETIARYVDTFTLATARAQRLLQLVDLQRTLRGERETKGVDRRPSLTSAELYDHYLACSNPVVVQSFAKDWPAWTLDRLLTDYGNAGITVCTGRASNPQCDRQFKRHETRTTLGEYLQSRVLRDDGPANDAYAIANNRLLSEPELAPLLKNISPPEELFDAKKIDDRHAWLWLGPAKTHTPMHHDQTNNMFCQLVGRKRFSLVSPFESKLLFEAQGFYTAVDIGTDAWAEHYADIPVSEVVLEPGDALLIPAGWWHAVDALEPSVSLSLLAFYRDNNYPGYAPGKVGVD